MYLTPGFRGLLNNLIYAEFFFFFFFGWDKVDECIILLNYTQSLAFQGHHITVLHIILMLAFCWFYLILDILIA